MRVEDINEPIQVLALCAGGTIRPLRFRWSGRTYRIEAVNGQWTDRGDGGYSLNYSVQVGDETYFIRFAGMEVQWWLDRQMLE